MAYSRRIESYDAETIRELAELTDGLLKAVKSSQSVLVEIFPILNLLPRWLAPWKVAGDIAHERTVSLFGSNLTYGQNRASWNWAKAALEIKEAQGMSHDEMSYIIGVLFEAGSDTTTGVLKVFVLACLTFPEAMTKAQEELEQVSGLPSFSDLDRLPYLNAFVKECLRWRPLAPFGFPHAVDADDEYMGYHIPKGSTVIANHWTLDLDENIFECATDFRPERWIENPNLPLAAFGFGRRGCIGRHVAYNSLLITIGRILWTYDVTHRYKDGKKIEVDPWNMQQNMTSSPEDFEAVFRIRSLERQKTVEDEWNTAEKDPEAIMNHVRSLATSSAR
ncbi:hypothetical protein PENARI_c056G02180 [Penicillium arizonense]|uniref:Cytochrome P450 n=1 Tax=Penicillium arizonense TaxID=1835702 RepID=A0A1F5L1X1_PENAI|nr:hypothetical protein PENARI_c056G02180 [Penicillium arizonense]OGE47192.1 hypothetical protein PENARI_c056G02180 [Penicillium arizonense]